MNADVCRSLKLKNAFEAFCCQHGHKVHYYHCNNGHFDDNLFLNDVAKQKQTNRFCGVKTHHQNGLMEKAICNLQEQAKTILLHTQARWPQAIHTSLWPSVMRTACYVRNILPSPGSTQSRLEKFAGVAVTPSLKDTHTFGWPVYALRLSLAANKPITKWDTRARLGVYLHQSPRHAQSFGLVLNLTNSLVSTQFHEIFDNFFKMTWFNRIATISRAVPCRFWLQGKVHQVKTNKSCKTATCASNAIHTWCKQE